MNKKRRRITPLVYLYGFTPAAVCLQAAPRHSCRALHGVEEGVRVECIAHRGIGAVVSFVPAAVYEERPLEAHLKDPCWLALRVERHNRVLRGILEHVAVAPCRFGTLFRSTSAVKEVIARHGPTLAQVLRNLEGRQEWSVKAYLTIRSAGVQPVHSRRAPMSRGNRGAGAAYLLGLVQKRSAQHETNRRVQAHAKRITGVLAKLTEDMAPLPLRISENGTGMVFLNLACLVKRGEAGALLSNLAKLAAKEKKRDITLAWSGPWPAYNFSGGLLG